MILSYLSRTISPVWSTAFFQYKSEYCSSHRGREVIMIIYYNIIIYADLMTNTFIHLYNIKNIHIEQ